MTLEDAECSHFGSLPTALLLMIVLNGSASRGRSCSSSCRKATYEDRSAHRDGAVQVQVVERVVTDVRERRIKVLHPRIDCIKSVLADEDAMIRVIWTLVALVEDRSPKEYVPEHPKFERIRQHTRSLYEAPNTARGRVRRRSE